MAYRHMLACASWRSKTTEPKTDWRLKTDLLGKFLNLAQVRVVVHVISADHTDRHLNTIVEAKVVKWNADASFVPTNTSEWFSDPLLAKWDTIMPLDASQSPAKGEAFSTTSMTHSLHCTVSYALGGRGRSTKYTCKESIIS